MANRSFCIIGAGAIGTAFGVLLQRRGYECAGVSSRTLDSARSAVRRIGAGFATTAPAQVAKNCGRIFITTPDGAIAQVCAQLVEAKVLRRGQLVLHSSGAFSRSLLAPAALHGALTASLHPLQSFAAPEQALEHLPGSYFCIDADPQARSEVRRLVRALKGHELEVASGKKALYHAAACVMSNSLAALIDTGLRLFEAAGIPREQAWRAAMPLLEGTLANIGALGLPQALTGPLARGDLDTIRRHRRSLPKADRELRQAYNNLARIIIPLACAKGSIDEETAAALRKLLR